MHDTFHEFTVASPAGGYVYHPLRHARTGEHIHCGFVGLLIVHHTRLHKVLTSPSAAVAGGPGSGMSRSSRDPSAKNHPSTKNWRDYEVFLEPPDTRGRSRAYVCVYPVPRPKRVRSRFVVRLDLPETYATRHEAVLDAADLTHRYFHRRFMPPSVELSAKVKDYRVTGSARFRADIHEWEPWLEITIVHEGRDQRQRFEELDSPFYRHTFASREAAAQFALVYGERMVLGAVRGLRI